jgi:eukaryotic-like serine/threonine-protein kinase
MASGSDAPGGQRTSDVPPRPSLDGRETLGKYQIVRQLGAGGMGTVYLAVDTQLKRTIALKVLPKERTENETLVRRFESEAQAAAQLKHENIVTVYDAGRIDGHLYIALEFVEGTDIHELVARRGPLPLKRSLNFIKQIAHALDHLSKRGFVHRDIKPSNILVTREGTAKLTDMGLARAVDESLNSSITREGTTVGTVDYMAPEQARNSQAADIRSDIYSLGCTWYQMLTGEPPFPTGSVTNKLYAHISKPRPDPRALNRSVPEEVVGILHRMMARKPVDRHQTPSEVLEDLANLGSGNRRIEELLSSDADDSPTENQTPLYESRALPPRHLLNRSSPQPPRYGDSPQSDSTPRPDRLPARRSNAAPDSASTAHAQSPSTSHTPSPPVAPPLTPPPQRMPARQTKDPSDGTPMPARLSGRNVPGSTRDNTPRSGVPTRRSTPIEEQPVARGRVHHRSEQAPPADGRAPAGKQFQARAQLPGRESASVGESLEAEDAAKLEWKPVAKKAAAVIGGVLALGACVWLGATWRSGAAGRGDGNSQSPFAAVSANLPADADKDDKDDVAKKPDDGSSNHDLKKKLLKRNEGVLVDLRKANDGKSSDPSNVVGRPEERKNFPSWIAELWNPNATPTQAGKLPDLKTVTVGRVGDERATAASLASAIEQLPNQGGIIELRGRGPFILPAIKIANHGRIVITSAAAKSVASNRTGTAETKDGPKDNETAPLIVIVPGSGARAESGVLAIQTSLTLYGVQVAAFADQFSGDNPFRLIDVRSGDLILQKSSLTLVGARNGSTIAFSVSNPIAGGPSDRPTRILLDRTIVRGKDLTALEADLSNVDLLAINSLFVTGIAPVLNLTAGRARGAAEATTSKGVARELRFFSCTTCTEDVAVSVRLGSGGASPPHTRFQVLNSVFGAVFESQGLAMIGLNDWPSRPITATNPVAFENLTWMTESFVARGWKNLVQSNSSPPLGTKDAARWAAYWGEQHSSVDSEPASFPSLTDIATADLDQFKWDTVSGRPGAAADTSPPGCDVGLLKVIAADSIVRGDVLSRRPKVPATLTSLSSENATVKEIDLDNPNRRDLENLAKYINRSDWKSGTRFLVRGTNRKTCGPIHVSNRSLSIEFVDPPPLLTFEDSKGESRDHAAFIAVSGGSIQLVNANFRVGTAGKRFPHYLLEVKDGSFAIRDSSIEGPLVDKTGYEGLIHFSSTRAGASSNEKLTCGEIRNSFLRSGKTDLSGDLISRNLIVENSVLAANGRVLDLHLPAASPALPVLDLSACTIAAGEEYFHFDAGSVSPTGSKSALRVRIIADNTVFAPPLRVSANSEDKAMLIGGLSTASIAKVVDWWDYACAYSNLISLPDAGASGGLRNDPLAEWKQAAGPAHIVRPAGGSNAVLLQRDLPSAKELVQGDFRLKTVAEAFSWSDIGTPIGAVLDARMATPTVATPGPKAKSTSGRKTTPTVKSPPPTSSGI